jgi:SAM-dependent methyltransferase
MAERVSELHEANRAAWNEAARKYSEWEGETIAFIRAGKTNFVACEYALLGELRGNCRRAIHLQCASGQDTLSLWNLGAAEVVGIDISDVHVENARRLAAATGAPATFVRSDLLSTPAEYDGTADLVYTGRGALNWLHDLGAWAKVIARLLRPGGGRLYVFEGHPMMNQFDIASETWRWTGDDYFATHAQGSRGWPTSYLGDMGPEDKQAQKWERMWTLADVVNAVIDAGLRVDRLVEHREDFWTQFPKMPEAVQEKMPRTFSLLASRVR